MMIVCGYSYCPDIVCKLLSSCMSDTLDLISNGGYNQATFLCQRSVRHLFACWTLATLMIEGENDTMLIIN